MAGLSCVSLVGKGESFHRLGECVNYGDVCVCVSFHECTDWVCYFIEFIIEKFHSLYLDHYQIF